MSPLIPRSLLLGASILVSSLALAQSSDCVRIPDGVAEAPVTACARGGEYLFDIAGDKFRYEQSAYQDALRDVLEEWLTAHARSSEGAQVEVWLAVPEISPQGTQMRAAVELASGERFVAYMPVRIDEWTKLGEREVGIMPANEDYPEYYGDRAASILVQRVAGVSDDDFTRILAKYGATEARKVSGDWYAARTAVFGEARTADRLMRSTLAKRAVKSAQLNSIVEWIALRERVFAFTLD